MTTCTTVCEDSCDAYCHEVHEVGWKRNHQPEHCPAWIEADRGEFCTEVVDLLTFGGGIPVPQAVLDRLEEMVAERDSKIVGRIVRPEHER
jgi:hypothetical protein